MYPKDKPREAVLVYVKDVNYQAARSLALSYHWAWLSRDTLTIERQPRWDTKKPPKRFCIMDDDLKAGLPRFGELRVKIGAQIKVMEKAWKVYHDECREEDVLVYANTKLEAEQLAMEKNRYAWTAADRKLLRMFRVPRWDHQAPPERVVLTNDTLHRDLPDFFSNIEPDGVAEHYVRTGREGQE